MFIDFRSVQFTIHFLKMGLTNVSLSSAEATVGFGNGSLNWTLGQNGTLPSNSPSFEQESLVSNLLPSGKFSDNRHSLSECEQTNANSEQLPDCQSKHRGFVHHSL